MLLGYLPHLGSIYLPFGRISLVTNLLGNEKGKNVISKHADDILGYEKWAICYIELGYQNLSEYI